MAEIVVNIGSEEKAVCGLTSETTCAEVIDVLLKDKHTRVALNESSSRENERYLIEENYRGNVKVVPRQTRILLLWKTWGREQHHVKFSLKNENVVKTNQLKFTAVHNGMQCQGGLRRSGHENADAMDFLQKHSPGQIRQLRRNIKEHKRAMHLRQMMKLDDNNNSAVRSKSGSKRNSLTKFKVMYSDEHFADGISIDSGKERSLHARLYRPRTPQSLDGSCECSRRESANLQATKPELHHYPYCVKSKHSSASRRRAHHHKQRFQFSDQELLSRYPGCIRNSVNFTTSKIAFNNQPVAEADLRFSGDDADDEKSILTDLEKFLSSENFSLYSKNLLSSLSSQYKTQNISVSTTTVTDSSTTTSSDTSNTSSSSFSGTSSSDTSASSADWGNEAFFAKRAAAAATAQQHLRQKSKGNGVSKFFKLAKLNSSKKKKKFAPNMETHLAFPVANKTANDQTKSFDVMTHSESSKNGLEKLSIRNDSYQNAMPMEALPKLEKFHRKQSTQGTDERNSSTAVQNQLVYDSSSETTKEQLRSLIQSQQQKLNELCHSSDCTSHEIDVIELQIHKWSSETCGKNRVQEDNSFETAGAKSSCNVENVFVNSPSPSQFLRECNDVGALQEFVQACERIVDAQMRIEDFKRRADICCQDLRDEVWRLSSDPESQLRADDLINLTRSLNLSSVGSELSRDNLPSTTAEDDSSSSATKQRKIPCELDALEMQHARAEFEANFNLSLRLTSELEEVEMRMSNCRRLLQGKDQKLLDLVRELAQSSDGISPALWEEYGELLTAYDEEIALQTNAEARVRVGDEKCMQAQRDSVNHEEAKRELASTTPISDSAAEQHSPSTNAVNHALSPWQRCQHCKQEKLLSRDVNRHAQTLRRASTSTDLKPKKKLLVKSSSTSLLPMFPVSISHDCDYDEVKVVGKAAADGDYFTSTIISTESAVPRRVIFHHDSVDSLQGSVHGKSNESNSTDDSGNVSAGSACCDSSGSPRASSISIESQDSAHSSPLFFRDQLPSFFSQQTAPTQTTKPERPPIPVKSRAVKHAAALLAERNMSSTTTVSKSNHQDQKEKLIRRNSNRLKKSSQIVSQTSFSRRASSFGKCGLSPKVFPSHDDSKKMVDAQVQEHNSSPDSKKSQTRPRIKSTPSVLPSFDLSVKTLPLHNSSLKNYPVLPDKLIHKKTDRLSAQKPNLLNKSQKNCFANGTTCIDENDTGTRLSSINKINSFEKLSKLVNGTLV